MRSRYCPQKIGEYVVWSAFWWFEQGEGIQSILYGGNERYIFTFLSLYLAVVGPSQVATGHWSHRCVELGCSAGGPAPAHFWFQKQVEELLEAVQEVSHAVFGRDLRNQLFFPFFPYMQFQEPWPEERSSKYPKCRKARRWRRIPKPLLIVTSTESGKPWWVMRVWKKSAKCASSKFKFQKHKVFFKKTTSSRCKQNFWKMESYEISMLYFRESNPSLILQLQGHRDHFVN